MTKATLHHEVGWESFKVMFMDTATTQQASKTSQPMENPDNNMLIMGLGDILLKFGPQHKPDLNDDVQEPAAS